MPRTGFARLIIVRLREMLAHLRKGSGWESWPEGVVSREADSFHERAQTFMGVAENKLKAQLGEPSQEAPGTRWGSAPDNELTLQADRDLRYFGLLPHVIVSFAIARGCVVRVFYLPKWRKCPVRFRWSVRGVYAPK